MATEMVSQMRAIVEDFLSERHGRPPELSEDDNLLELGYLDSTEYFDLIAIVETELGVSFDFLEGDPADLVSIAGLARYVKG